MLGFAVTDLTEPSFAATDLTGTDLTGDDLTGDDLTGADLPGADLIGADLSGADVIGAAFAGIVVAGFATTSEGNDFGDFAKTTAGFFFDSLLLRSGDFARVFTAPRLELTGGFALTTGLDLAASFGLTTSLNGAFPAGFTFACERTFDSTAFFTDFFTNAALTRDCFFEEDLAT